MRNEPAMKTKTESTASRPLLKKAIFLASCMAFALGPKVLAEAPNSEQLADQLTELTHRVEQYRQDNHIAGMALAVVKDGEVLLSETFGHARLGPDMPVSKDSQFIIGSSTKSFTAVLSSQLVEEGVLRWDTPVAEHLPEFGLRPRSKEAEAVVTLEDVLSHRSGFPRMSMLWVTAGVDRQSVFEAVAKAKPIRPFRERFNYNNVLFSMGAESAAKAAGSDWAELIETRLFEPLGMRESSARFSEAIQGEAFAYGYGWDEGERRFERQQPIMGLGNVEPAGAIVSNIADMTKWVTFLSSKGENDGRRLVSAELLEDVWTSRVKMSPQMGYGIGWFLDSWKGRRVVHHGGNIQGYACQVAIAPEDGIGLVLMANVTMTPLQAEIVPMVLESVLEVRDTEDKASPEIDYAPFVGEYVANFGPFSGSIFTVKDNDGVLAIDVPGQTLYDLKSPDEDGKWFFEMTDQIAISFDAVDGASASGLKLYQSGMTFEMPRKGEDGSEVEILSRASLEELMGQTRQLAALEKLGGIKIEGIVKLPNTGLEGTFKSYFSKRDDEIRMEVDFGSFGWAHHVYANGTGEIRSSYAETKVMSPEMMEEFRIDQGFVDLFAAYDEVQVVKEVTVKEKPLYQVIFRDEVLPQIEATVHQESGRVLRVRTSRTLEPGLPAQRLRYSFGNYKSVQGCQIPHRFEIANEDIGRRIFIVESVEVVETLDAALFNL